MICRTKTALLISAAVLSGLGVESLVFAADATDLTKLTIQSLPHNARADKNHFFSYMDFLKDGKNNGRIEEAKKLYEQSPGAHINKAKSAIEFLRIAPIVESHHTAELKKG